VINRWETHEDGNYSFIDGVYGITSAAYRGNNFIYKGMGKVVKVLFLGYYSERK
jgi:hypothetical protein